MDDANCKWNRQELYEKAWLIPLRKLATEYGVSDVALGKVCRKLQIPLPGLGHWTKIECGQSIPRPPLPVVKDLPVLPRQIPKGRTPLLVEDSPKLETIQRIEESAVPSVTNAILAHPLLEKTKRALSGAQITDRGVLWPGREADCLDLRVSKACLSRALRITAATLHMLEREGFSVQVDKRERESTSATIYGEAIRFGVVERSRQVKPAPPTNGKSGISTGYIYNSIKLQATGKLSIEVWNYFSGGFQKAWRDRDSVSLEEQLPRCVAGMVRIALAERAERDAREKKAQAKQKQIDEVTDVLRQIEDEEKKIKTLARDASAWKRAERIRDYVAAVRRNVDRQSDPAERTKLLEWIAWAERQADRIDPLKETPDSIVDDKEEVVRRLHSVRWGW